MSIGKGKNLKPSCKVLRVWTKNEENFEIFYKNLWKIDFFHNFLLHISWSSASSLKVYIPLEDNTRFLQQFFRFRGGAFLRSPVPTLLFISGIHYFSATGSLFYLLGGIKQHCIIYLITLALFFYCLMI